MAKCRFAQGGSNKVLKGGRNLKSCGSRVRRRRGYITVSATSSFRDSILALKLIFREL
jgi:hypothetical protein